MAYELNKKLKGIEPYSPINENYAVRLTKVLRGDD